jgi:DNA (cytosine-5)-methyltransferase 1
VREYKLTIQFSAEEKRAIDDAAQQKGTSPASWGREQLASAARNGNGKATSASSPANCIPVRSDLHLLSLFCGPGGLDQGFREAGFTTDIAFDIDQDCVNTFAANHGGTKVFREDISKLNLARIDELYESEVRVAGVIGGPPCQSFSVSNVHQAEDDPRHDLPVAYANLLKEVNEKRPLSFFVFENVPGLLGERHRHRYEQFKSLFSGAGFEIFENTLDAQEFGVPQVRPRVFIVGINRTLHPNAVWKWPEPEKTIKTVRDTIERLPPPVFNGKGLNPSSFEVHPNHWCMVPRSRKFETNGALVEGQAWGRSFRTLAWDEPSWTVAYGNREVHVHPSGTRRLSIYEAMLLQSFPKWYIFTGNISAQTRLVSEAVAPRMAWHLAVAIRRCLGI